MKTIYKLLGWVSGIAACSALVSGIILPLMFPEEPRVTFIFSIILFPIKLIKVEGVFKFFILLTSLSFASIFFHKKGNNLDWDNDLFFLYSKLFLKRYKSLKNQIVKKTDETKDKIKNDLNND